MKTVRASEIGSYVFCQRAWKYQQQQVEPHNQSELAAGVQVHYQHNRKLLLSSLYKFFGVLLLAAAAVGFLLLLLLGLSG